MGLEVLLHNYFPLFTAVLFYTTVFSLGELSRRLVERVFTRNTHLFVFFIELVASAQMCSCVYENGELSSLSSTAGIILRHYGVFGFFIAVALLGMNGARLNRGAFVSPLAPIEAFYYGLIPSVFFFFFFFIREKTSRATRLTVLLAAQVIGGYAAFRVASTLWFYSMSLFPDHDFAFHNFSKCHVRYHVSPSLSSRPITLIDFFLVVVFEIVGCFLIRSLIGRLSDRQKPVLVPVIISSFLSFGPSSSLLRGFLLSPFLLSPFPGVIKSGAPTCDEDEMGARLTKLDLGCPLPLRNEKRG